MIKAICWAYWGMSIIGMIAFVYIDWQHMLHECARVSRKGNANPRTLLILTVLILLISAPLSLIRRLLQGNPTDEVE